jgi:fructose-1-phosphate kinase PfkB-like protein
VKLLPPSEPRKPTSRAVLEPQLLSPPELHRPVTTGTEGSSGGPLRGEVPDVGGDFGSAVAVDHAIHAEHVIVSYGSTGRLGVQDATSANAASTIAARGDFGSAVAVDHAIHVEHVIVSYRRPHRGAQED